MDDLTPGQRRLKHALLEMQAHKLLKKHKLTPLQRLFLRLGDNPPPLEYAPFTRVFGLVTSIATTIFVGLLWPAFAADPELPGWVGLIMGLLAGVFFGLCFAGYLKAQHRWLKLTPWEQLDTPPDTPEPDELSAAAIDYMVSRFGRHLT